MKHKSNVFGMFKKWKAQVENQTGRKIKYLKTDNGLEYRDKEFIRFCELEVITYHFTVKGTPQQNGVVKRMNRTLAKRVRCMRLNAGLLKVFYAETVNTVSFIINRSPSSTIDFKILEEVQSGKLVDYSSLNFCCCPAYVHVQSGERSKLDSKSRKCAFLSFERGVKGYKLWDPISKKTLTSKDVIFDEAFMLKQNEAETCDDRPQKKLIVEVEFDENSSPSDKGDAEIEPQQQQEESYSIAKGREKRVHKAPQRYGFEDVVSFALITSSGDPLSYRDVEEIGSLQKNKTWEFSSMLTKSVPTDKFKSYLDLIGVCSL